MLKKFFLVVVLGFLAACASQTGYQDVGKNTLTSTFSVSDQKMLLEQLSDKLVNDQYLASDIGGNRPTLLISVIKNKTSEQIDTESITDTLKMKLVKSRMFSVINRDNMNVLAKELEIVQSPLSDKNQATQMGRLWGAKYVLYGNFSSIVNYARGGKEKQVYYKLTLVLQNIETGEELFIDEAELNKVTK